MTFQPYMLDIVLGLCVAFFLFRGWQQGFIRTAGGLLSLAVSVIVGIWGISFAENISGFPLSSNPIWAISAFFVLFGIARTLMYFVIMILDVLRKVFTLIPGVGLLHRVLGLLVGALEGGVFVCTVSYFARSVLTEGTIQTFLFASSVIQWGTFVLGKLGL